MADGIVWEVVRGIGSAMVDSFGSSLFFEEKELSMEGVVQMVVDGRQDFEEQALKAFVDSRASDYLTYLREEYGITEMDYSLTAMNSYLDDRGIRDDYVAFSVANRWRWNGEYRKDEVRQAIVDERLAPLFANVQRNDIYIYRDSDHWGIHLRRLLL